MCHRDLKLENLLLERDSGAEEAGTREMIGWEELSDAHGTYYRSTSPMSGSYNGTMQNSSMWQLFLDGEPLPPSAARRDPLRCCCGGR